MGALVLITEGERPNKPRWNFVKDWSIRGSRGELVFGLASEFLGLATLVIVLFAPLYSSSSSTASSSSGGPVTVTHSHSNLWSNGIHDGAMPFLLAIALAYVAIGVGTVLRVRWQLRMGSWLRWCGVAVAFMGSLAGAMTIGLFLVPAATLGLIAALGGVNVGSHSRRREPSDG